MNLWPSFTAYSSATHTITTAKQNAVHVVYAMQHTFGAPARYIFIYYDDLSYASIGPVECG